MTMKNDDASGIGRRAFMDRMLALGAAVGIGTLPRAVHAQAAASDPDDAWMRRLTGKHKQVFPVPSTETNVLGHTRNWLNAWRDAYHVPDADLTPVIVIYARAVPMAFTDQAWTTFGLGERSGVKDGDAPARRNVFRTGGGDLPADASLDALMARGAVVLLCNNSFNHTAHELAAATRRPQDEVRAQLTGWIVPGITVVPAAVVAIGQAQEHGCTFFYAA